MNLLGSIVDAGKAVIGSDAGAVIQDAAAKRAASEINRYTGYGASADTQSPTAKLQAPTPPATDSVSVVDQPWFWPAVAGVVVVVVVIGSLLFRRKGK